MVIIQNIFDHFIPTSSRSRLFICLLAITLACGAHASSEACMNETIVDDFITYERQIHGLSYNQIYKDLSSSQAVVRNRQENNIPTSSLFEAPHKTAPFGLAALVESIKKSKTSEEERLNLWAKLLTMRFSIRLGFGTLWSLSECTRTELYTLSSTMAVVGAFGLVYFLKNLHDVDNKAITVIAGSAVNLVLGLLMLWDYSRRFNKQNGIIHKNEVLNPYALKQFEELEQYYFALAEYLKPSIPEALMQEIDAARADLAECSYRSGDTIDLNVLWEHQKTFKEHINQLEFLAAPLPEGPAL